MPPVARPGTRTRSLPGSTPGTSPTHPARPSPRPIPPACLQDWPRPCWTGARTPNIFSSLLGSRVDRRPLDQRIADIVTADGLAVGEAFPSASALAERFGVSRPTVTKALEKLETAGVLAGGGQGRVRTVRAVPTREERL
ncbi:GntR family transcriptional regulator [Streptomyces sp. W16]|uniref:GntR family transcriptional regulator n=1 Tax=Streptomyces sp. W16 TaxID=3076631 RepID=UPI00295AE47E|nr:GntR family transcriptional regulator [Streptomyces sp. W16]MDV9173141.1 GntR family transcriptional regulator [Streptomyces sp. W16]